MLPTSLPVGILSSFSKEGDGKKSAQNSSILTDHSSCYAPGMRKKKTTWLWVSWWENAALYIPTFPHPPWGREWGGGRGRGGGGGGGNQPEGQDALFSGNWDLLSFPPLWPPLEDDRSPKRWWERCTWSWSLLFNTSQINLLFPYIPDVRLKWRQNIQNRPKKIGWLIEVNLFQTQYKL